MITERVSGDIIKKKKKLDSESEIRAAVELGLFFAGVWSFGASMFEFEGTDYSEKFSKWWMGKFKVFVCPRGSVFDLYLDIENEEGDTFVPWFDLSIFTL